MNVSRIRMRVPDLRVQADVAQIKEVLASAPGINHVAVDYEAGIVEVTTAAQDGGANTINMLSQAGYPPSETEFFGDVNRRA